MKKIFILIFLSFCSDIVFSAAPGTWTPASEISHIFIEGGDDNPILTIVLANDPSDDYKPALCKSHYLNADLSSDKGKSLYSLVLASKLSGKSLSFTFSECYADRPKINQVRFQ